MVAATRQSMAGCRIAVDARPLCHPGTGIYRYTRELLTRMCRLGGEWFLYSPQRYAIDQLDMPNIRHRTAHLPTALRVGQSAQLFFPLWARRDRVNVFWGPRHQLPVLPRSVRTAVTVHDFVWKDHGDTMRFPGRQIEDFFTPRALARADVIAVVSQFTRSRLEHYFPQFAHKVSLVPGASMLRAELLADGFTTPVAKGDYFLFVGTLEPRKNLPRLLRAYRRYVSSKPGARPLKIAGGGGWGTEDIAGLVNGLGLQDNVQLLGKVDDVALRGLYLGAFALLMPSLYEGFGLPVVEALSAGVPVLTSRGSAMEEAAGTAGLFVDPRSEDEILRGILTLSENAELYSKLAGQASAEASRYDWELSSALMADLLFK